MVRFRICIALLGFITAMGLLTAAPLAAQEPAADTSLPVQRVVLYKSGIGYFEHLGQVSGDGAVTISFTSSQLDDVLKTLTVLDLDGGRVVNVGWNSVAPIDQRLRNVRLPLGDQPTLFNVLNALRGTPVEVRIGSDMVAGRVLSAERHQRGNGNETRTTEEISIVTDDGELRRFEFGSDVSIRLLDEDLRQELGRYLTLLESVRDEDVRRLTISTQGSGDRSLFVSYVSEVPIWKSSYRIVLPSQPGGSPILQGWAIVDNTVGEDWENVELSLVAGAPQSFIQQISQPYYARRPVVPLPDYAQSNPQTHDATLAEGSGRIAGPARVQEAASPAAAPAPPARAMALERVVAQGLSELQAVAEGQELGDLFEYRITDPVTIRRNQSALVPILRAEVSAEKVSLWSRGAGVGSPLRALWLTNDSGLSLDGGSFTVLEDSAFAGEGLLESMEPGERRLLSYGTDVAMLVDAQLRRESGLVTRVIVQRGLLIHETDSREHHTYTIRNQDDEQRTVVVEHRHRPGWEIISDALPEETAPGTYRFRVVVEPQQTATLTVAESRPIATRVVLSDVTDDHVALLVQQGVSRDALERALRPILAKKSEIATVLGELAARRSDITAIERDQQRLRENIQALGVSTEERQLVGRYVGQLDQQEDRLEELRRETAERVDRLEVLQRELQELIETASTETDPGR